MIVKLKCVDNIYCNYLTSGKVYDAIKDENGLFAIVDDEGDLLRDSLEPTDMFFAIWEVVN